MAARENKGLQAALIIFVLITIGLATSTWVCYRDANEKSNIAKTATDNEASTTRKFAERNNDARCLKYMLGWDTTLAENDYEGLLKGSSAEIQEIAAGYKQDMEMYGKGIDKPNYRIVPAELLKVIKAKNEELATAIEEQKKLNAQLVAAREEAKKEIETAKKGQEEASAELVKRTADFETERKRKDGEMAKIQSDKESLSGKLNEAVAKSETQRKTLNDAIVKKDQLIQSQKDEIKRRTENENFEVPSGQIRYVNQRQGLVLINLGSADGLRPQINFSVYDQDENSATRAQKKAAIEVVRITDAHLAEARIIESQVKNPILPGDNIYSPIWQPGQRLRFALTGFMDIDGDGSNDREKVRNLIEINGGEVVVEQGNDGRVDAASLAKMTLQTRYLVEGDLPPASAMDKTSFEVHNQGRNAMITKAQELGIDRITPAKILGYMGYRGEEKTVNLSKGAMAEPTRGKVIQPKDDFRPRQPPPR
jgi:hypothetical protein